MIVVNNPVEKTPLSPVIHECLQTLGADTQDLDKSFSFESWTRWGKNNRYTAKLIRGRRGNEGIVFQDFASCDKPKIAFFQEVPDLSDEEINHRKTLTEQAYQEAVAEMQRKQEEAAILANHLWQEASQEGHSNYLKQKQVLSYGLRFSADRYGRFLVIPLYDTQGKLWNVQKIYDPQPDPSNHKWFLTGGRKKGCFYVLGHPLRQESVGNPYLICEGYATGASLHAATGLSVVVAFDANNLDPVLASLQEALPSLEVMIAADNDQWHAKGVNKGLEEAQKAASVFGCSVIYPTFKAEHHVLKPTDFNDLHCLEGLEAVQNQVKLARHKDVWHNPQTIHHDLLPVEPLPLAMVPESLKLWLQDISYRMQCPLEQAAIPALVMIGSVIGAGCSIRPKRHDSWMIVPNLWGGIIGPPSSLKSPALAETLSPLVHLEKEAREEFQAEQENYLRTLEAYKIMKDAKVSQIKSGLKSSQGSLSYDIIAGEMNQLEIPEEPSCRRFKTNDTTIEKMTELLEQNPRGLMLFRDELMGLLTMWDRQGREADRAFYLEAWNGYGSHTTDRIERGTTHCDHMCVSIMGGTQPTKILRYLQKAIRGIDNDGLVQRFQLFVYPDDHKNWKLVDHYPDQAAKQKVFQIVKTISEMDFIHQGAYQEEEKGIPYYRFSQEAQELFYEWLTELETVKLRGSEDPILVEHLAKYRKLMPALALIFHVIEVANGTADGDVSLEAAQKAAAWCDFLELHAKRIYGMARNITLSAAAILFKNLKQHKLENGFTVRDVYRKEWSLLSDKEVAQDACDELVHLGWLKEIVTETAVGQKGKVTYKINPKIGAKL